MAIEVWTIQMGKWRKAKELGIELVDITVKSGDPVFAPDWAMVQAVKNSTALNKVSVEDDYRVRYHLLMQQSW